jgi:hypothetical protein
LASPRPLTYNRFIKRLGILEIGIPYIPADPGIPFIVFRWSGRGTYGGQDSGPHYVLIHRDPDDLVPAIEIQTCLWRLCCDDGSDELIRLFWEIEDHVVTEVKPTPPSGSPPPETRAKNQ